ncbi:hypothetical protein FACS1894113_2720 [Alphaproteobacteria bacterium]|nr:hypothetical protein FACS1894113_2720 [Alphaproteobacteria bacterium]
MKLLKKILLIAIPLLHETERASGNFLAVFEFWQTLNLLLSISFYNEIALLTAGCKLGSTSEKECQG